MEQEPLEPEAGDCCGEGCTPCVWDVYRDRLAQYRKNNNTNCHDDEALGLSKVDFTWCTLVSVQHQTHDTSIYRFEAPGSVQMIQPAQHLELRAELDAEQIVRKYSPIWWEDKRFDVLIKRYPEGKISQRLQGVREGDPFEWRGPYGRSAVLLKPCKRLILLCAGTGIAPVVSLVRSIVQDSEDETELRLLCACHSVSSRLLLRELKSLAEYWNFSFVHYVSEGGSPGWGEKVVEKRLTREDVLEAVTGEDCGVVVCGPDSFVKDMESAVRLTKAIFVCLL